MEPAAREMLAKDVESHAMALSGCERAFREANLKCILDMDRRNKAELLGGGTAATSEVHLPALSDKVPRTWRLCTFEISPGTLVPNLYKWR